MAGHSKWANIKHRKSKQDAAKGKLFTKVAREIIMAAKAGGGDPAANFRLRIAVDKARAINMPTDNINRAIARGTGSLDGASYEEFSYEGYGPGGVAIMLDIATDNRNRTAGDMRHLFSKYGGNLGETGCVNWMFNKTGLIVVDKEGCPLSEDELMLLAAEAGADDLVSEEENYQITCSPDVVWKTKEELEAAGIAVSSAEITYLPTNTVKVEGDDVVKLLKLMDALDEHDDVQEVYANFDMDEE
jgi:YebC/PmpR family DNA-binding regulatory protein